MAVLENLIDNNYGIIHMFRQLFCLLPFKRFGFLFGCKVRGLFCNVQDFHISDVNTDCLEFLDLTPRGVVEDVSSEWGRIDGVVDLECKFVVLKCIQDGC